LEARSDAGVTALVVLLAVLSPRGSDAAAAGKFLAYDIRVLDRITDVVVADLDGDSLKDLVVLHTKDYPPHTERWVSLFWQKKEGGFSSAADRTWELPDEISALDVGDILADPGEELVGLTRSSVCVMSRDGPADSSFLRPIVEGLDGSVPPSPDAAPWLDFVRDWDGDGLADLAVPCAEGLFIYKVRDDTASGPQVLEFERRISLAVKADTEERGLDAVSVTVHLPFFTPADLDGDGDLDIASHWNDELRLYLQTDGLFSRRPDSSVRLDLLTEEEKAEGDFDVGVAVTDVDGDGMADLFAGKSASRGVADFFSSVVLYYGDGEIGFDRDPDWTASVDGMSRGRWLDLDGDGRKELVMPVVKLSIADLVRILLTKKVKVRFCFYFIHEDRTVPAEPDFTREVTLQVGLDEGGAAQIVNFEGDYNGDGRKDMVVATGDTELSVYLGKPPSKGELFQRGPAEKIRTETYGVLRPVDLDGDGRQDMILFNRDNPREGSRARILMNVGPW